MFLKTQLLHPLRETYEIKNMINSENFHFKLKFYIKILIRRGFSTPNCTFIGAMSRPCAPKNRKLSKLSKLNIYGCPTAILTVIGLRLDVVGYIARTDFTSDPISIFQNHLDGNKKGT